jgi:hypothetical protein
MKKLIEDMFGSCFVFLAYAGFIMSCLCEAAFIVMVLNN